MGERRKRGVWDLIFPGPKEMDENVSIAPGMLTTLSPWDFLRQKSDSLLWRVCLFLFTKGASFSLSMERSYCAQRGCQEGPFSGGRGTESQYSSKRQGSCENCFSLHLLILVFISPSPLSPSTCRLPSLPGSCSIQFILWSRSHDLWEHRGRGNWQCLRGPRRSH